MNGVKTIDIITESVNNCPVDASKIVLWVACVNTTKENSPTCEIASDISKLLFSLQNNTPFQK